MLETVKLTKKFGELIACNEIELSIQAGEIHALLGENGAGKSTLVKMLFGALLPTSGQIKWQNQQVSIRAPAQARALGIGMVFQHFSLFNALSVAENIALSLGADTPLATIAHQTREVSNAYGLPLDPDALVGDLSVGERQRIEIIRCLLQEPSLIILDEPTSVLTPQEADRLFETLFRLKDEGKSVLYISHRLEEVQKMCDTATILRHGRVTGFCNPAQESASSLAKMMVGEDVAAIDRTELTGVDAGETILKVTNLSQIAQGPFSVSLKSISLELMAGDITGIAGVAGNGQSELFDALSGEVRAKTANSIVIDGNEAGHLSINQRRVLGAAFVPEERLGHGAAPEMSLSQNLLLSRHKSDADQFVGALGMVHGTLLQKVSQEIIKRMDVRKGGFDPDAASLSGGNLQKFLVGRELDRNPKLIIINQPTWGVDAGAARHIRQSLIDLAKQGAAVLVISQDLDELFEVCNQIAVIHDGELSNKSPIENTSLETIGLLMGGAQAHNGKIAESA